MFNVLQSRKGLQSLSISGFRGPPHPPEALAALECVVSYLRNLLKAQIRNGGLRTMRVMSRAAFVTFQ